MEKKKNGKKKASPSPPCILFLFILNHLVKSHMHFNLIDAEIKIEKENEKGKKKWIRGLNARSGYDMLDINDNYDNKKTG
jgi:hypothetical protein